MKPQKSLHMLIITAIVLNVMFFLNACREKGPEPELCQSLNYISGNNQIGKAGQALTEPLKVRVTDENGQAKSGVAVTWTVESGGGSLNTTSTTTNTNGEAEASWTIGNGTGTQKVKASIAAVRPECTQATSVDFTTETIQVTIGSISQSHAGANTAFCGPGKEQYDYFIPYSSNVNLNNYYAEVGVEYKYSNGTAGEVSAHADKIEADKLTDHLCVTWGIATYVDLNFIVKLYTKDASGNKTGSVMAQSNRSETIRTNKPAPVTPIISISGVASELVAVNNCSNGGSLFRHTISYTANADLTSYFVEVLIESVFSNGEKSDILDNNVTIENGNKILTANCTKFGETTHIDRTFVIRLYAKDSAGNKTGPVLATSNKSAVVRNNKPGGGARISFEQSEMNNLDLTNIAYKISRTTPEPAKKIEKAVLQSSR